MHLTLAGLFKAKWTNEIHEEWIRNLLKQRPDLSRAQLERTRDLMNAYALDCLVEDYQDLIPKLTLPDSQDRHVLAAAIKSESSLIITYNLKDFPINDMKQHAIQAMHPDDFLTQLYLKNPETVYARTERLRLGLKNPPLGINEYWSILKERQLEKFVQALEKTSF